MRKGAVPDASAEAESIKNAEETDMYNIMPALKEIGYSGYISDEYEKLWYPDFLPEPEIGMKHNLEYVRKFILD